MDLKDHELAVVSSCGSISAWIHGSIGRTKILIWKACNSWGVSMIQLYIVHSYNMIDIFECTKKEEKCGLLPYLSFLPILCVSLFVHPSRSITHKRLKITS